MNLDSSSIKSEKSFQRINDQYRIIFDWIDNNAYNVLINKHDKNYGK